MLTRKEIVEQSERAVKRWESIWHENAKKNSEDFYTDNKPLKRSNNSAIVMAFGPSLKNNIQNIVGNELDNDHDTICIDKSLKFSIDNGLIPNICVVADAQVNFEKYGQIEPSLCKRIKLIMAVTANYKWSEYWKANGGEVYYYVNKDNIRSHKTFGKYFKDKEKIIIPASSNVGNSAYVIAALVLEYKTILLAGYDYSWRMFGTYYGDNSRPKDTNTGNDKLKSMNHDTLFDINGDQVQSSENMIFSAKWLIGFIHYLDKERNSQTINCTGAGILTIKKLAKFKEAA